MFKKIGIAAIILLCAANLYSLSFSVNSDFWKTYSNAELRELTSELQTADGRTVRGIALSELFPVLYDAWTLDTGLEKIEISNLADKLHEMFLADGDDGWEIVYGSQTFSDVRALNIEGEKLAVRPLEIWINWEGTELLREEIERYADLHRLEIKITEVPKPDSKLISVTRGGGSVPDIIMVQSSAIDSLVRSGSIQNIDYMYPEGLQEQGREAFSHGGRTWAVPFYYDSQLVLYNPELISEPSNDWTLTDFERICGRASKVCDIPSAWNAYSASFLIPFQISFGKDSLVETDGSIDITDEASRKALEYVLHLQDDGLMQPMERDAMTSLFVSGDVAMILSASYSIPHFTELGVPFKAAALPINEETGRRVSPLLDFKAFAVTKKSRNTTGARRLIEHLTGPAIQGRFTSEVAKLPARESVFNLTAETNPYYETLKISAEAGTIIPTDKAYSVYKNTMWKMLRFALSGRMSAARVLEKTQKIVDKNLDDLSN